jgi:hypothetical protein
MAVAALALGAAAAGLALATTEAYCSDLTPTSEAIAAVLAAIGILLVAVILLTSIVRLRISVLAVAVVAAALDGIALWQLVDFCRSF